MSDQSPAELIRRAVEGVEQNPAYSGTSIKTDLTPNGAD